MPAQRTEKAELKMYSDFKSPYAFLAFDPGMTLGQRFDVRVRWIPFQLRVKGKGERSVYSEYKVKYSYMDASALGETAWSLDPRPLESL
jgi:2-hydroxychromene-2-carboxylate isomerase